MGTLRACYQQGKPAENEWKATQAAYYAGLRVYGPDVLCATFDKVLTVHPNWFPTLGQLQHIALNEYKRAQSQAEFRRREVVPQLPPAEPKKPNNSLTVFVQEWEQEANKDGGLSDERRKARLNEFNKLLAETTSMS